MSLMSPAQAFRQRLGAHLAPARSLATSSTVMRCSEERLAFFARGLGSVGLCGLRGRAPAARLDASSALWALGAGRRLGLAVSTH